MYSDEIAEKLRNSERFRRLSVTSPIYFRSEFGWFFHEPKGNYRSYYRTHLRLPRTKNSLVRTRGDPPLCVKEIGSLPFLRVPSPFSANGEGRTMQEALSKEEESSRVPSHYPSSQLEAKKLTFPSLNYRQPPANHNLGSST